MKQYEVPNIEIFALAGSDILANSPIEDNESGFGPLIPMGITWGDKT